MWYWALPVHGYPEMFGAVKTQRRNVIMENGRWRTRKETGVETHIKPETKRTEKMANGVNQAGAEWSRQTAAFGIQEEPNRVRVLRSIKKTVRGKPANERRMSENTKKR